MLVELPNGDWIKPEAVTAIQRVDNGCYLQVSHNQGTSMWRCTPCVTKEMMSDLADTVNRACYKAGEGR